MESSNEANDAQRRLREAEAIDAICDSFETAWRSGPPPDIEAFLAERGKSDETRLPLETLFRELVLIDAEYRIERGEPLSSDFYTRRFPELDSVVEEAFSRLETLPEPDAAGRPLHPMRGRFELLGRLGEGSFGVVWRARDLRLKRIVALKQFRGSLSRGNWAIVEREAQAAARLDHPNIARILEVSESIADPHIVFEFVDGENLKVRLEAADQARSRPSPREAAGWMAQVARGLEHIHAQGLIHRDIKPANIILSGGQTPKIVDFGLARHVDAESSLANERSLVGTLPYMSPEQCLCRSVDARTDVYSLGVVLYELLAGHRPYDGKPADLVARIPRGNPPPLPPGDGESAVLQRICLRAMGTRRDDRYQSAGAMADDLERSLRGQKISPAPRVRRLGRRAFAVTAATGIATAVYAAWGRRALSPDRALPPGWHEVALTTQPAGAKLVFIPLERLSGRPLPENAITAPSLSPVRLLLPHGDYLVVALLEDESGRFHEVFRHVPADAGARKGAFAFQRWRRGLDGIVQLEEIVIPPRKIAADMHSIGPGDHIEPGQSDKAFVRCAVPKFLVDRRLFTIGDYKQVCLDRFGPGNRPFNAHVNSGAPDDAVVNVSYEEAIARAEDAGKRLLHEWEFCLLADLQGPVDEANGAGESPSVTAEWVESYLLPHSELWNADGVPRTDDRALRTVRAVSSMASAPSLAANETQRNTPAGTKLLQPGYAIEPWLGFRCARSPRPRLTAEDFPRLAERDATKTRNAGEKASRVD